MPLNCIWLNRRDREKELPRVVPVPRPLPDEVFDVFCIKLVPPNSYAPNPVKLELLVSLAAYPDQQQVGPCAPFKNASGST